MLEENVGMDIREKIMEYDNGACTSKAKIPRIDRKHKKLKEVRSNFSVHPSE